MGAAGWVTAYFAVSALVKGCLNQLLVSPCVPGPSGTETAGRCGFQLLQSLGRRSHWPSRCDAEHLCCFQQGPFGWCCCCPKCLDKLSGQVPCSPSVNSQSPGERDAGTIQCWAGTIPYSAGTA